MAKELEQKGKKIKVVYAEPADYFSKSIRQKYRLGEYHYVLTNEKIKYLIKSVILGHAVGDALAYQWSFAQEKNLIQIP